MIIGLVYQTPTGLKRKNLDIQQLLLVEFAFGKGTITVAWDKDKELLIGGKEARLRIPPSAAAAGIVIIEQGDKE